MSTPPQPVPPSWRVSGPAPLAKDKTCRICGLAYTAHSGATCGICRRAVEHHGAHQGEGEVIDFADCLAGQARMAAVRQRAGVATNDIDLRAMAETT